MTDSKEESAYKPILNAFYDLLKFSVINFVNTGNRAYDSSITMLLLAILTFVFACEYMDVIIFFDKITSLLVCKKKSSSSTVSNVIDLNDMKNYNYYKTYVNTEKYKKGSYYTLRLVKGWDKNDDNTNSFVNKLYNHVMTIGVLKNCYRDIGTLYASSKTQVRCCSKIQELEYMVGEKGGRIPIFVSKEGIAYLCRYEEKCSEICIRMTPDPSFYNFFVEKIKNIIIDEDDLIKINTHQKSIYTCSIESKENKLRLSLIQSGLIYPNRIFDNVVTRHKKYIINMLDNFIEINRQDKNFFGSYNFGMILYGIKGTGKTMITKSICNYLNRDAVIIDMSKIDTKQKFEFIMNDPSILDKVIVLDEFDFVQGIIQERSLESENIKHSSTSNVLADLKSKKMQMMNIIARGGGSEKSEIITSELEALNKKIQEKENGLTLETMLTIFDGISEVRNRCIIATTNYIDKIDSALIREGRFDLKIELTAFNNEEIHDLLKLMLDFTDEEQKSLNKIKFKSDEYTPAKLIHLINTHKKKVIEYLIKD